MQETCQYIGPMFYFFKNILFFHKIKNEVAAIEKNQFQNF